MDLHLLTEAKPRSAYKQRYKTMYVGKEDPRAKTRFGPEVTWSRKVEQYFYDARVPNEYRARIFNLLRTLEKVKGPDYMKKISDRDLYYLVKNFAKRFELQRHMDQTRLGEPGTSGAHSDSGVQTWQVPASWHTGLDLAGENIHRMTAVELERSPNQSAQKIFQAVRQDKPGHLVDKAVVWDAEGRPYYVFVQLHMRDPMAEPVEDGKPRTYEVVVPTNMDFRGSKKLTPENWKTYHKGEHLTDTDFRRAYRKAHSMSVLKTVTAKNFESIIHPLQEEAWKFAKIFWFWWGQYQDAMKEVEQLEAKMIRGVLSPEERGELRLKHVVSDIYHDILLGKMPQMTDADPQEMAKWSTSAQLMPESYTWYLWLLASEQEYGIRVPERQGMYPRLPVRPAELKGEEPYWAIRPKRVGGERTWRKELARGVGYSPTRWDEFREDLVKSGYTAAKNEGGLQRVWVPVTDGKILAEWGMRFHPSDINDYLNMARSKRWVRKNTGAVAGKIQDNLKVVKLKGIPQYVFIPPGSIRELALIPAAGYLQTFDSPAHPGERLIHGRHDFAPAQYNAAAVKPLEVKRRGKVGFSHTPHLAQGPVVKVQSPITDKTRARAAARRAKKFHATGRASILYDPYSRDIERMRGEIILADKLIRQRKLQRAKEARWKEQKIRITKTGRIMTGKPSRPANVQKFEMRPVDPFHIERRLRRMELLAKREGRIIRTGDRKVRFKPRKIKPRFVMKPVKRH